MRISDWSSDVCSSDLIYGRFVGLVAQSRRKTPQQIDAIAQGRVWDGGTARQIGLVDRFGGLEEAVAEAAKLAKIDPAKARPYRIAREPDKFAERSEEHTSETPVTHAHLVCRLLLETKNTKTDD